MVRPLAGDVKIDSTSPAHAYMQLAALLKEEILSRQIVSQASVVHTPHSAHAPCGRDRATRDRRPGSRRREHLAQTARGRRTFVTGASHPARRLQRERFHRALSGHGLVVPALPRTRGTAEYASGASGRCRLSAPTSTTLGK
jgi:hypothetical protein